MKGNNALLLVVLFLLSVHLGCTSREIELKDLQMAAIFDDSGNSDSKIISDLEMYFQNLQIPDSLKEIVNKEVSLSISNTTLNLSDLGLENWKQMNEYKLEGRIKSVTKSAMIALAQGHNILFNDYLRLMNDIAVYIDTKTQNDYWVEISKKMTTISENQAYAWLRAETSQTLCYQYHNNDQNWHEAELFAAYGLQELKKIGDLRLELDIWQRLQVILAYYYGFHDLSILMADNNINVSEQLYYHLRTNGMRYHLAEALYEKGHVERAMSLNRLVIDKARRFRDVQSMLWYEINGTIMLSYSLWQMGRFEESLELSKNLKNFDLNEIEMSQLYNIRGLIFKGMGNYEQSESNFKRGIIQAKFAESIYNQIVILSNLADLYAKITEYQIAIDFFDQATKLVEEHYDDNYIVSDVYVNKARLLNEMGQKTASIEIMDQVDNMIQGITNIPVIKADILTMLGELSLEFAENHRAYNYFVEAESICESIGLIRQGVRVKILKAKSLVARNMLDQAGMYISEALSIVEELGDLEKIIDCMALEAEIEQKKDNLDQAINISNRLLDYIEEMSTRFKNHERLTAFRQKIYDYIKNSISYEITLGRNELAFLKLDYAKARSLKMSNLLPDHSKMSWGSEKRIEEFTNVVNQFNPNSILIDYLITNKILYALVLYRGKIEVHQKNIESDTLRKHVEAYTKLICNTIGILQAPDSKKVRQHWSRTIYHANKLYSYLFGWPQLQSYIENTDIIYIVPDEFLFDIPFSTLALDKSETPSYLITKSAVVYLPSNSFAWKSAQKSPSRIFNEKRVLISVDRNFKGAKNVIETVSKKFPNFENLTTISAADSNILQNFISPRDIYFIVGHGVSNLKYPEQSKVELTVFEKNNNRYSQFPLKVLDLRKIKWPGAEMVFLVGCETAKGRIYRSTGLTGLQSSFLGLGAESVIGSLWQIDAKYALIQLNDFINIWSAGKNPALIMQEIQIQTINKLKKNRYLKKPYPYFWGCFTIYTTKI